MKRLTPGGRLSLIAIAVTFAVAAALHANAEGLSAEQRSRIDAVFAEYSATPRPGCAAGVMKSGHLVHASGYGLADVERRVPITPATLFDIGSTSKQFTAAALVLLEIDGKLSLSDDVRKYVPELPDYGAPITIDHLLRHTSGLRDYTALLSLAGVEVEEVSGDEQALAIVARQRNLNFPSGSRYEYSNTGYFLGSLIVERVSGKSLAEFARERIFEPLGMSHALFRDQYAQVISNRALGYAASGDTQGAAQFRNALSNWQQTGDGALHLSIEAAARWDRNFYQPSIGGAALVDRLQQPGQLDSGESIAYARGLFVDEYRGEPRIHHAGNWVGYNAMLARFPRQQTSIAIFCNFEGGAASTLSDRVADIVLSDVLGPVGQSEPARQLQLRVGDDEPTLAARFDPATPSPQQLQAYTGTFHSDELDVAWPFLVHEGRLAIRRETRKFVANIEPLQPAMQDSFSGDAGFIRFTRDAAGRVTGFDLSSSRMKGIRFERRQP